MDVWNDWYSVVSLDEAVIMKNLVIVISHYFIKCEIRGWVRQEGFWSFEHHTASPGDKRQTSQMPDVTILLCEVKMTKLYKFGGGVNMWYDKLFIELESLKDETQSVKMSAYMKNNFPFLGLPKSKLITVIKPYIKTVAKEKVDWNFVDVCWEKDYREAQYTGVEYLFTIQKKLIEQDMDKLRQLIITKSWWDTSDSLDRIVGLLVQKHPILFKTMLDWSKNDNIWLRRVAIDFQLQYKEDVNVDLLEEIICNNFGTGEFFINKAIGWSLRDYSKVNPTWVESFIERHRNKLSKLSIKEASKYL
jgi:3-methyladenine DNA glycosylase AlkD